MPQSAEEAAGFIGRIGIAERMVARIEHDMNDQIARIKAASEEAAAGYIAESKALTAGLQIFCDANRDRLTDGGKVKHAEFGTGSVEWRQLPPSVRLAAGVKADQIVAWIRDQQNDGMSEFNPFLRIKEEIDKDAMRARPELARTIPGVTIGSAGEQFTVSPFEARVEGGKA